MLEQCLKREEGKIAVHLVNEFPILDCHYFWQLSIAGQGNRVEAEPIAYPV